MTRLFDRAVAALGLFLIAGAAQAANLIRDGGFEQPPVPVGGFIVFSTGQKFGPWVVVGASGNVAPVSTTFTQNGFSFPAQSGKQWLDLTGESQSATGVQQSVRTVPGGLYDLSFFVGNIVNPNGIFGTTSTVHVFVNGALLLSAVNRAGNGSTKQVWKKFSASFNADGNSTTIAFINGDPSNDTNCGLDAVTLTPQVVGADEAD